MAFHVFLVDLKKGNNPDFVGTVNGETPQEVILNSCNLIETKYTVEQAMGKSFEAIEFGGRRRQLAGSFNAQ